VPQFFFLACGAHGSKCVSRLVSSHPTTTTKKKRLVSSLDYTFFFSKNKKVSSLCLHPYLLGAVWLGFRRRCCWSMASVYVPLTTGTGGTFQDDCTRQPVRGICRASEMIPASVLCRFASCLHKHKRCFFFTCTPWSIVFLTSILIISLSTH
jgi:hypothetical protein